MFLSMSNNKITKSYNNKLVLDEANISFEKGTVNLILGKNGSGKTTLFKILYGLIQKYSGKISDTKYSLLVDNASYFNSKSGYENLKYFLTASELIKTEKYILLLDMNDYINLKVKTYSEGMKKKLGLVLVLSKNCEALLLDEPTNSLDIESVTILKTILKSLKGSETIIISSHDTSIFDSSLIDNIYMLKNKKFSVANKSKFNFLIYKVKTSRKITEDFDIVLNKDEYLYIKILPNEITKVAARLSKYGLLSFMPLDYLNELYIRNVDGL